MSLLSSLFAPAATGVWGDWAVPSEATQLIHGRSAEDGGWLTAGAGEDSDSERETASVPPESTAAERSDDEVQRPLPSIKSMWRLMLQPFKRSGK